MKISRIISLILVLVGCFLFINAFSGIAGNAIASEWDKQVSSVIGLVFIFLGLFIFFLSLDKIKAKKKK